MNVNKLKLLSIFLIFCLTPLVSTFNMNRVKILSYTFNSIRLSDIFFEASQAPIAPKEDGGYYLCYRENTNYLHVAEFDKSDNLIKNETLTYKAIPFDIVEINDGFAIYAKEVNNQSNTFLLIYNSKHESTNEATLMNKGDNPTGTYEAIIFNDSNGITLNYLNIMYRPNTAKLAYGNNRINLILSHYFGNENNQSGYTYYLFDVNGTNVSQTSNLLPNHSLIQSHIFDGKYFITASLGDNGIKITAVNGNSLNDDAKQIDIKNQLIIEEFKGNFSKNNSLGRLGGLMKFDDYYVIIYSVKKSDNENRDGIYLTKLTYDGNNTITNLSTVEIIKDVAGKLKNLRAAKYSQYILITYIHNEKGYGNDSAYYNQDMNEKMYYIVCDTDGNIEDGPLEAPWQHQALNEDIRPLKDESLRWGYIDKNNVLRIVKVEREPIKVYVVMITAFLILIIIAVGVILFLKYKNKNLNKSLTSKKIEETKLINSKESSSSSNL